MSSFESASSGTLASVDPRATADRLVPYFYAATLFASALLLVSIQPMFAKMVLPKLGGAPAVWSVAMVFFQTVLLAGYCYAHVLERLLAPHRAALFHLLLIGATATTLPIAIAAGWGAPPSEADRALAVRSVRGLDRAAILHVIGEPAAVSKLV